MIKLLNTVSILIGALFAGVIAWNLGGAEGTGVMMGYLLGAALASFGLAWQQHLLRVNPSQVLTALVGTFLLKLAVLFAAAVVFRYIEAAAARVDWRAFLVAYAAGVLVALSIGSFGTLRILRERRSVA